MKTRSIAVVLVMLAFIAGCASTGTTPVNTSPTNIAVTTYEGVGATLATAHDTEKGLVSSGKFTMAQDMQFQALYKKAYDVYAAIDPLLKQSITLTATVQQQADAQSKAAALMQQLPALIASVQQLLQGVK